MVRWRYCLILAVMLVLPLKTSSEEDDDEEPDEDNEENETDEVEEEETTEKHVTVPRTPVTRTASKRPLDCYSCVYKEEMQLRSCLDPTKHRVHTMTCHSMEEKCYTSVLSKGNNYKAITRGCRAGCVGSPDTTCCELNRCNNQAFTLPVIAPRVLPKSKAAKALPQTVLFFVTVLLVLQTVVKVAVA